MLRCTFQFTAILWTGQVNGLWFFAVYFCTHFCHFIQPLTPFLSFHMLATHKQQRQDTRNHHIVTVKIQSQDYCTQDRHHIRWTTASTCNLFYNPWILKSHVKLLQSPICHQLINPLLFVNNVLDQLEIQQDVMIQLRTQNNRDQRLGID